MGTEAGNSVPIDVQSLEARQTDLRAIQDYLEDRAMRNVARVAYSTDGRTFGFEAPLALSIPVGCFVHLKAGNGREYLGQIITKEVVQREGAEISLDFGEEEDGIFPDWLTISGTRSRLRIRALEGSGVLLGRVTKDGLVATSNVDTFQQAAVTPADMTTCPAQRASGRRCPSATPCTWLVTSRWGSTPAGLTDTPSCAASRAQARPFPWASSWNSCCWRPSCA